MESLSKRLELVQEELLTLYEEDSERLEDQVRQWTLIRKENALLHAARRKGIMRLGMNAVPTLASSEHRAREAIEMTLYLESLLHSPYGTEPWTLQQTTRERLLAPPQYCFKKGGYAVDVVFDGDPNNAATYTAWEHIYYQNGDDAWHKVPSHVDHHSIYYVQDDGLQVKYISFQEEAEAYSRTGKWQVFVNNKPILPSSGTGPRPSGDSPRREGKSASPKTKTTSPTQRLRRRARQHVSGGGRQGKQRRRVPPSPEEVGSSHTTPATRPRGRLETLLQDARDPPAILLKGRPNVLKCFRYYCKAKHPTLCKYISTTFSWTTSKGTERVGEARVIIVFSDPHQRSSFLSRVKIPASIQHVSLNLDGI